MQTYLATRPDLGSLLFIHANRSPLTKFQFNRVLSKCCQSLQLKDNIKISSHSFRIEAAKEAARIGFDCKDIKTLGRWKSDSYKLYVRP